ncbi:hypothetical protein MRX96_050247 [Rhipicephalus microplus]
MCVLLWMCIVIAASPTMKVFGQLSENEGRLRCCFARQPTGGMNHRRSVFSRTVVSRSALLCTLIFFFPIPSGPVATLALISRDTVWACVASVAHDAP